MVSSSSSHSEYGTVCLSFVLGVRQSNESYGRTRDKKRDKTVNRQRTLERGISWSENEKCQNDGVLLSGM